MAMSAGLCLAYLMHVMKLGTPDVSFLTNLGGIKLLPLTVPADTGPLQVLPPWPAVVMHISGDGLLHGLHGRVHTDRSIHRQ